MKNLFFLCLFVVVCAGCRSNYDIHLNNSQVITAKGKPHLDKERNAWVFTDASGQVSAIPAGRVTEVSPQSMDDNSGKTQFISSGSK
jgi:uncharacterized protein YcfL